MSVSTQAFENPDVSHGRQRMVLHDSLGRLGIASTDSVVNGEMLLMGREQMSKLFV